MPTPQPGPVGYLAKAILAAFQGRNGLLVLVAFVLYRRFSTAFRKLRPRAGESLRQWASRTLLLLPPAKKQFSGEISKSLADMRARAKKSFDEFAFLHTRMPDDGLSMAELKQLVDRLAEVPQRHCEKEHMSGSIYSYSYMKQEAGSAADAADGGGGKEEDCDAPAVPKSSGDYLRLSRKLKQIFTCVHTRALGLCFCARVCACVCLRIST
jgi:hypothetical protein